MTDDEADEIIRHFDLFAERISRQLAKLGEQVALLNEHLERAATGPDRIKAHAGPLDIDARGEA